MVVSKQQAIDAFKGVMDTREPRRVRILGQLGDATGEVSVTGRPNYVYVRLSGDLTRTVRALNTAVPPIPDKYVWVEIVRAEGQPRNYRVIEFSDYSTYNEELVFARALVDPTEPSSPFPGMVWVDTSVGATLKVRNLANDAWLTP